MSAGHARAATPLIAVAPQSAGPPRRSAAAGGEAVTLDRDPVGLVWTGGTAAADLRGVLAAHPQIAWVQLPLAGVEALAEGGVIDRQRQWTSAKGAYAEPVAEHALALLLAGLRQLPMRARARSWGEPGAATLFDQPVTVLGGRSGHGVAAAARTVPLAGDHRPAAARAAAWRRPDGRHRPAG